jgi:hypothetical protein
VRAALWLAALVLAAPAVAEPLGAGSSLAPFSLEDQHGVPGEVDSSLRALLFTRDMGGGDVAKAALAQGGAERLARASAVYVADVHRMPGIIRRAIAEPRLRRRPYRMLLDREGEATRDLPAREGEATLLVLDALRVVQVEHYRDPAALAAALEGLSR